MAKQVLGGVFAGIIMTGLFVVGCGHKNPLVGTWTGTRTTPQGVTENMTLVLTDDGKDTATASFAGPNGNNRLDASGTYVVSGDTITQTYTTLNINGRPLRRSKGPVAEPGTFKVDGDTLTLVSSKGGPTEVLTRQKA